MPWIIRQLIFVLIIGLNNIYYLVIFVPFLASILLLLSGNYFFWKSANLLLFSWQLSLLTFFFTLALTFDFFILKNGKTVEISILNWIDYGCLNIKLAGLFDTLTIVMLLVITVVSLLVQYYSKTYMKYDPHIIRFIAFLFLFTFFMILLVTSNNFIQLFTGWEGVGICSYLLINFWYTRIQANKAAIKAILVNRVGDTALAVGIFLVFVNFQTLDFYILSTLTADIKESSLVNINTIAFFFFLGAMGKSAQIGLHTWLPDAMEGPTPVSALLHAATMVTAGVFLLIRCSFLFQEATYILPIITIIGSLTTFLAASIAIVQNDIKKVIAYSTCSQLGYMFMACGLQSFNGAIFHLYNHAFFKALLFLTAGSIIHALDNEQDLRKMGGLINLLPFSYCMMLIGSLALMGFPFLSGYYSKEFILEISLSHYTIPSHFAFCLGTLSSGCTAFYSMRSLILIFFGNVNSYKKIIMSVHDTPLGMLSPMIVLAFLSLFTGFFSKDFFIGLGTPFWSNSISIYPVQYYNMVNAEFLPFYYKIIPLWFSFTGTTLAFLLFNFLLKNNKIYQFNSYYTFFNKKWFFDLLYNDLIIQRTLSIGYNVTYKLIDRGILETIYITGFSKNYLNLSTLFKQMQAGHPYHYLILGVIGGFYAIVYLVFFFNIKINGGILFLLIYLYHQ